MRGKTITAFTRSVQSLFRLFEFSLTLLLIRPQNYALALTTNHLVSEFLLYTQNHVIATSPPNTSPLGSSVPRAQVWTEAGDARLVGRCFLVFVRERLLSSVRVVRLRPRAVGGVRLRHFPLKFRLP